MKRWIFKPPTQTHLRRLADWAPQYVDGDIVNGCMEMDDYAESIQEELEAATISFDPSLAYSLDDMPIFRYDDPGFQTWLNRRIEICDAHRENQTQCLLPWEIQKALNAQRKRSDRLYFSQNKRPSCVMHADGPIPAGAKIVPAANGRVAAAGSGAANVIGVRVCSAESYSVVQPGDTVGVFPVFD